MLRPVAGVVRRAQEVEPGAAVLVAGLGLALYLQGAFTPVAQALVAVTIVVAAVLAPGSAAVSRADVPVVVAAGAFAGWALLNGVLTGHVPAGVRYALLVAGVLVVAGTGRRLAGTSLVTGLLAICCAVAAVGWFGVVVHHPTWGFLSPGMWRASSTLTYPNATAAVLAMAALVCFFARVRDGGPRWSGYVGAALVTGLAATLSRAGLSAFVLGLVVLGVGLGWRPLWRAVAAPLCGALVATVGLVPSILPSTPSFGTVAVACLAGAAGLVVGGRAPAGRWTAIALGAGLAVVAGAGLARLGTRFSVDSPDRWGAVEAAWQVFVRHPVTGAGPGLERLVLARDDGGTGVYLFAHNEYVQILAELGLVGGLLVAAFLSLVLRRSRGGALAVVAALALHAGFDFVWHVPAVPLLAAAFVGVATGSSVNKEGKETKWSVRESRRLPPPSPSPGR